MDELHHEGHDRADLGDNWASTTGSWSIEGGALRNSPQGGDSVIYCARPIGKNERMEFDAWSMDPQPNDLSGLLCGELTKGTRNVRGRQTEAWLGTYDTAYFFGFGGEGNAFSKFMVRGVDFRTTPWKIVPGKKHHIVCQREGTRVTHVIDGNVLFDGECKDNLDGTGNVYAGFYLFKPGFVDNVKLYTK